MAPGGAVGPASINTGDMQLGLLYLHGVREPLRELLGVLVAPRDTEEEAQEEGQSAQGMSQRRERRASEGMEGLSTALSDIAASSRQENTQVAHPLPAHRPRTRLLVFC